MLYCGVTSPPSRTGLSSRETSPAAYKHWWLVAVSHGVPKPPEEVFLPEGRWGMFWSWRLGLPTVSQWEPQDLCGWSLCLPAGPQPLVPTVSSSEYDRPGCI